MHASFSQRFTLDPENNEQLLLLCGEYHENLQLISERLAVDIRNRGHQFTIIGDKQAVDDAAKIILALYDEAAREKKLDKQQVHLSIQEHCHHAADDGHKRVYHMSNIKPRSKHQQYYLDNIHHNSINFGIGPAGTGKTFLAVACAVEALKQEKVSRIVLVRPAVEAGEKLGFLPGDMAQKVDPYLRPLYDALFELLGVDTVNRLLSKNIIEIAPLAYMRGRTLNDAFIILDESQNTTVEQMKMFLTRIGFGSTAVVNGDITQIDLPRQMRSGLVEVIDILKNVAGISFTFFDASDVVRHPIVQSVIRAYERYQQQAKKASDKAGD